MNVRVFLIWIAIGTVWAQTQVDLRTQSRNVDFSAAVETRPEKTGTTLPATCNSGDLFFNTGAAAGANLYGCVSTNQWSVLSGGGSGSGAGASSVQSGSLVFCADNGDSSNYACSLTPPITSYAIGMVVQFSANTTNNGAATLNLNNLGAQPLLKNKSQTLEANDILAGQVVTAVFDGSAFEMQSQIANYLEAGPSGGIVVDHSVYPWTVDIQTSVICFSNSACAPTGTMDLSAAILTRPSRTAASDPATCSVGESYYNTTVNVRRDCTATNTWSAASQVAVPANSSVACSVGSWATDGTYFYLCITPTSWKRVSLSSF
jgi:hypothetical protein